MGGKYWFQKNTVERETCSHGRTERASLWVSTKWVSGYTSATDCIIRWHDYALLLLSPLTQSKEKVFIPNLLDFERYWTGLIDEHWGALTADPATQVFSIWKDKKRIGKYMHATRQQSRGESPCGSYFVLFCFDVIYTLEFEKSSAECKLLRKQSQINAHICWGVISI